KRRAGLLLARRDNARQQGAADAGAAMPRIHGDRDQVREAGGRRRDVDQRKTDGIPRGDGDEGCDVRTREKPFHDRAVLAESKEGLRPETDDERGVFGPALADRQPLPILRTIAHSASVTGWT